ncbi:MAG: HEAT repeat domain-containing protein [Phycisphaerae bacterium]
METFRVAVARIAVAGCVVFLAVWGCSSGGPDKTRRARDGRARPQSSTSGSGLETRVDPDAAATERLMALSDPKTIADAQGERWQGRAAAAVLAFRQRDAGAEPMLLTLAGDDDEWVRAAALIAMGGLPAAEQPATAIEPSARMAACVTGLGDPAWQVRRAAAWALGASRCTAGIEPLIAALQDDTPEVVRAAAAALVEIGAPAVPALAADLREQAARKHRFESEKLYGGSRKGSTHRSLHGSYAGTISMEINARRRANHPFACGFSAAAVLSRIGPQGIEVLEQALAEKDTTVTYWAAEALSSVEWQPRDTAQQLQHLVALRRWYQLVELGGDECITFITDVLRQADDSTTAREAARVLRKLNADAQLTMLMEDARYRWSKLIEEELGRDSHSEASSGSSPDAVRDSDLRLLDRLHKQAPGEKRKAWLVRGMRQGSEHAVRFAAARELIRLGDDRGVQAFAEWIAEGDDTDRSAAIEGLEVLPHKETVELLLNELREGNCNGWLESAVGTGLEKAGAGDVDALLAALKDESYSVRLWSVRALGYQDDPRIQQALIEVLNDEVPTIWCAAGVALGRLGAPQPSGLPGIRFLVANRRWSEVVKYGGDAVPPLIELLGDVGSVTTVLGQIGAPAIPALAQQLEHRPTKAAIEALCETRDARALRHILPLLSSTYYDLREVAAENLWKIGDCQAVAPLIEALLNKEVIRKWVYAHSFDRHSAGAGRYAHVDQTADVRAAAAWSLAHLKNPASLDALLQASRDSSDSVRGAVAYALGKLGDGRAVHALIRLLGDESTEVREAAWGSLVILDEGRYAPACADTLGDWMIGPGAALDLDDMNWVPLSDRHRVYYHIAKRDLKAIDAMWPMVSEVLLSDAAADQQHKVANAVSALVAIGKPEVLDSLCQQLHACGSVPMAEVYLNCGNERLRQAAKTWARSRGYEIRSGGYGGSVQWGGMQ